jgi:hypothetical protein
MARARAHLQNCSVASVEPTRSPTTPASTSSKEITPRRLLTTRGTTCSAVRPRAGRRGRMACRSLMPPANRSRAELERMPSVLNGKALTCWRTTCPTNRPIRDARPICPRGSNDATVALCGFGRSALPQGLSSLGCWPSTTDPSRVLPKARQQLQVRPQRVPRMRVTPSPASPATDNR